MILSKIISVLLLIFMFTLGLCIGLYMSFPDEIDININYPEGFNETIELAKNMSEIMCDWDLMENNNTYYYKKIQ